MMATKDPLTHIGAQNLARSPSDFVREGDSYINFAPDIYHELATILADRVASRWLGQSASPGPSVPETFAYRSSWGDVLLAVVPGEDIPSNHAYEVRILSGAVVKRTLTLDTGSLESGVLYADYPVEMSIPDLGEPPASITWQVVVDGQVKKQSTETPTLSNKDVVKKVALIGINSLGGGYFNDLSDFISPGGTGREGRRDKVAAATFRQTMADVLGLRWSQVLPVMVVTGSSPINPMPYQSGFDLQNYWWNPTTKEPGPNLLAADVIVKAIGLPPDYFMESGPGETTGISFAPVAQRAAILDAFQQSNVEMLEWMRQNWGNPSLEVWFQGATTSWWGTDIPPVETNAVGTKLLRDRQTHGATSVPGFKLGSYVPNSNAYSAYVNEMALGVGWIHYTVATYHAAAAEMAEAMALKHQPGAIPSRVDRHGGTGKPRPAEAYRRGAVFLLSWQGRAAANVFKRGYGSEGRHPRRDPIRDCSLLANLSGPSPNRSRHTAKVSWYGVFDVAEYPGPTDAPGPTASYEGAVGGGLKAPTGLVATKLANNDVKFSWNSRAGAPGYWYRNRDVSTRAIISEGLLSSSTVTFTEAAQMSHYGFHVSFVDFSVSEYDATNSTISPSALWNGNA